MERMINITDVATDDLVATCTLAAFLEDNGFAEDDAAAIMSDLDAFGLHEIGGGAGPAFEIRYAA